MIKIEKTKLYMTAGETCHITSIVDGRLRAEYFGKRVEPEDNIDVLLGAPEKSEFAPTVNGKTVEFEYVDAQVLDEKPRLGIGLTGGKTLQATLASGDITADIYYTPYSRGGFSRRVVITNNGKKPITVSGLNGMLLRKGVTLTAVKSDGEVFSAADISNDVPRAVDNFIACVDGCGGAYGFLCVYGDGIMTGRSNGETAEIDCDGGECVVGCGESYSSPEVLAVYADNGMGGMSRVLHDILRSGMGGGYTERTPIVLFCPTMPEAKLVVAAGEAYKLGCDVFAVDVGEVSEKTMAKLAPVCKATGIKLGVKFSPFNVKKDSAAFNSECKAVSGGYAADISSAAGTAALTSALAHVISTYGVEYLMLDLPRGGIQAYARGLYDVRYALATSFPELIVEWGIVPNYLRHGRLLCYPPCMMRLAVREDDAPKTAFDTATLGKLGYDLDPLSLGADMIRAVRAQVFSYQDDAPIVMHGDVYKEKSELGDVCTVFVTKDKSKAYVVCEKSSGGDARIRLSGLDEHNLYHVRELSRTFSGAALVACGIPLPDAATVCYHITQVADYE